MVESLLFIGAGAEAGAGQKRTGSATLVGRLRPEACAGFWEGGVEGSFY